ncbi:MAG: DDE domain-containing protein [Mesorhizobium sp.]|nr:MAG: DDE domain-containing protein [Mesorhizobium sp.]
MLRSLVDKGHVRFRTALVPTPHTPDGADEDDVWHLDEVVVRINGQKCGLWRAVDQESPPTGRPKRQLMPNVEHRSHKA